ncbi:DUF2268 domain-containing putative Zn-dependent protease [Clostridioides sp. ES-S-0048-02]|uniref:DUF2268 domain-containing protein n=1 Tax=Clostridioides sp. ES-S-0048-02 TaxID=2770777 RepID=UPI001D0FAE2C|nr:Zn-dependent protease [Clostridioides sp. ES-S-0048-02]
MNIVEVRSDKIYKKIMNAPANKKEDIYRYELMKPFEFKWMCINVPITAKQEGGYDVIMASDMMGVLSPKDINESQINNIDILSNDKLWNKCKETIESSIKPFIKEGYKLNTEKYKFSILLANPKNPYTILSDGYFGDGGIPGYIFLSIVPNEYTINRLPAALAHECNHNIRFQFINWSNNITLEEMMINEGLAENFATWMFGDDIAKMQGYFPVGLPYCAGYACGYYMIKYYLEKTNKSIVEATLLPYSEIIEEVREFWD